MDQIKVHEYLIKKPLVLVTKPFAQEVDVYKVNHKMFATLAVGNDGETNENGEVVKLETSEQEADVVPEEQSDVAKDDTK